MEESDGESPMRTRRALVSSPVKKEFGFAKVSQDGYHYSKKLGEGTFAVVLSARCKSTGNKVAVKLLKKAKDLDFLQPGERCSEGVTYDDVVDIFMGEIKCMERLGSHPNIVATYGKGSHFIVMESAKVDLYTIRHAAGTGLPLAMAKNWTQQILTGVAFVHKMGYVHQDLKSSNILIFEDRTAKLCDFGLARKAEETMPVDRELVTLWYRAPELLMGTRTYTKAVDEWSIGCIALELLLGQVPFRGHHECVCSCPSVSHVNYNSDQLSRIFKVVGTPTNAEDLRGMACVKHFVDWPHIESRLWTTIQDSLVGAESRMKACLAMPDAEFQQSCRDWVELVRGLLVLNPSKRITCESALNLKIFTRQEGAPVRTSSSTSPTSPVRSPYRHIPDSRKSQLSAESTDEAESPLSAAGSSRGTLPCNNSTGALMRSESSEILSRASSAVDEAAEAQQQARRQENAAARSSNFQMLCDNELGAVSDIEDPELNIGPIMH